MALNRLSKREKVIAIAASVFVGAAIIYGIIVEPLSRQWNRLNNELRVKMNTLKKGLGILPSYKAIEADYSKFSVYASSKKSEDETVADMLETIESLSRQDSCFIVNIKPAGVKKSGSLKEIIIDANMEATMAQFMKFLYDIENYKNMTLRVRRFTFNSTSGSQTALKGSFLITRIIVE